MQHKDDGGYAFIFGTGLTRKWDIPAISGHGEQKANMLG